MEGEKKGQDYLFGKTHHRNQSWSAQNFSTLYNGQDHYTLQHRDGQQVYRKVPTITIHQENANQIHSGGPLPIY